MYKALGYGKGDTVLAVVAIVVGCPALVAHHSNSQFPHPTYSTIHFFVQAVVILALWRANPDEESIRDKSMILGKTQNPQFVIPLHDTSLLKT